MEFVVIEGDNGTGKDCLAKKLAEKGYSIISCLPVVKEHEIAARNSSDKTQAFLKYNNFCGELAIENKTPCVIVRYWISTLAAAYADYIYDYDQVMHLTGKMKESMAAPDLVIRVWAATDIRINRIVSRNEFSSELSGDISVERAQRYEWISKEILSRSGYGWKEFDNTSISIDELANEVLDYIEREKHKRP